MRHFLTVDAAGCWVAVAEGEVVAFATIRIVAGFGSQPTASCLSTRAWGSAGNCWTRRLPMLWAARACWCPRSILERLADIGWPASCPSADADGRTVDRSKLLTVANLREGRAADFGWMDRLDTERRGAGHGPDHGYMLQTLRLVVSTAKKSPDTCIPTNAVRALPRRTSKPHATCYRRHSPHRPEIPSSSCITTANRAVDVGLAVGLDIGQEVPRRSPHGGTGSGI